jgi:SAM-dependent methyltransferase
MNADYKHRNHFRRIAPIYGSLRTTDIEPIMYIVRQLKSMVSVNALDIGCGTGRYTILLYQHLQNKLSSIYVIDYNEKMLEQLNLLFAQESVQVSGIIRASAMHIPINHGFINSIFTFNSIHYFSLEEFLSEAARILPDGGYLFVYTRLRSQNSRNIWGRFFPLFASKEIRLYEADEFKDAISKISSMRLQKTRTFEFNRKSNVERLCEQAMSHHYSTFDLYSRGEFKFALKQFKSNLLDYFNDSHDIQWVDENILLILKKAG